MSAQLQKNLVAEIDARLPQTQCGLCGYCGCMPYAQALADHKAAINLCPPGGVDTLKALALLLDQDPLPFIEEMAQKTKPNQYAIIRENECIGCTKCIQACPVDAIIGTAKEMHTVITAECTGCELCIPPCPVDCIDLILHSDAEQTTGSSIEKANQFRQRFNARQKRLAKKTTLKETINPNDTQSFEKVNYIKAAVLRARNKKNQLQKESQLHEKIYP